MGEAPNTVDDAIDALGGTPTTEEVFLGTRAFSARRLAASAVRRVLGGGGGGGSSSSLEILGPFTVAFDAPNLRTAGFPLTTLAAGTVIYGIGVRYRVPFSTGSTLQIVDDGNNAALTQPTDPGNEQSWGGPISNQGDGGWVLDQEQQLRGWLSGGAPISGEVDVYIAAQLPA